MERSAVENLYSITRQHEITNADERAKLVYTFRGNTPNPKGKKEGKAVLLLQKRGARVERNTRERKVTPGDSQPGRVMKGAWISFEKGNQAIKNKLENRYAVGKEGEDHV